MVVKIPYEIQLPMQTIMQLIVKNKIELEQIF